LLADNQLARAVAVLKRAVSLDPNRATLHSNLGYALQQARDMNGAVAEFREAIRLDEKLVSAWINLATALVQQGDRVEGKKALERAQKIDPTDPRVRANMEELRDLEKKQPIPADHR
jgi:Flp pilus assembly protein TadD